MNSVLKGAATVAALVVCLLAGLMAGPRLREMYATAFPPAAYETGDFSQLRAVSDKPVIMFTTSTCPYCRQAREFLDRKQIPFEDMVIDKSKTALQHYKTVDGYGVPILIIGDRKISGFNEQAIEDALKSARTSAY